MYIRRYISPIKLVYVGLKFACFNSKVLYFIHLHMQTSYSTAPGLVLRIREQIAEAQTRIEQINHALFEKTGDRFEDTLAAVNADDIRSYWESKLVELQEMLEEYTSGSLSTRAGSVACGDQVELRRIIDRTRFEFRLIDKVELFPDERCVSIESPLGRALLGKGKGEHITVETPLGIQEYQIVNVVAGVGDC